MSPSPDPAGPSHQSPSLPPDPEVLVRVDSVGKKFCRDLKRSLWYGVRDMAAELTGRPQGAGELRPAEFWAVRDVSFELRRGECLGLIGRNGAGKTTLLRMLTGLIKPDSGRIELRGTVGALIALGAGFNPILTGRENIYINGAILGLSTREIDAKMDAVIDYAELGEFIDAPVQSYSSGMSVRLGFSAAVVLIRPDVLFLDEVLAVGDIAFVTKCLNTMREIASHSAVVFVSHSMQYVSAFCDRVIVMNRGQIELASDNTADGIDRYFSMVQFTRMVSGAGGANVLDLRLVPRGRPLPEGEPVLAPDEELDLDLEFTLDEPRPSAMVRVFVTDESGAQVIGFPVQPPGGADLRFGPGRHLIRLPIGTLQLNSGKYSFLVAVMDADTRGVLTRVQGLTPFRVVAPQVLWCKIVRPIQSCPAPAESAPAGGGDA